MPWIMLRLLDPEDTQGVLYPGAVWLGQPIPPRGMS